MNQEKSSLFSNSRFLQLCAGALLFFVSFNMVIPELPGYLTKIGGESYLGYIIGLFTITALISRPFSGKLADRIGRVPIIVFGAAVSAICGLMYVFTSGIFAFLLLRLFHGFSTGFTPTGTSAYVADLFPGNRKGEALGLLSLSGSLGMAVGPALGSFIYAKFGYDALFVSSSISGFIAVAWMLGLKETLNGRKKFKASMLLIEPGEIIEPRVFPPALVLLLSVISFGTMITLIPGRCEALGMTNKGMFFLAFTLASITVRFGAGKISDRIGREKVLTVSTSLLAISMSILAFASSTTGLYLGAILFGLGNGINSPTVMAWAIDLSRENHAGRAISTVYMALEAGIGTGAFASGAVYALNPGYFPVIFLSSTFLCIAALLFLIRRIVLRSR
ncbi:MAG: MFS transporter [Bacteroidetes bacterium]|nr:MFS transporter [Bacteroidota bacterium]